ncbi:major facilitator superfamily domain-containing protein [Lipomyces kononenkoae]|uniref:Major facilitator superfamily domain-containing protein n=1 Tax=Lipomyces kononenkoae TaxID=34357 RepID=A0ACC3SWD7_LIPKO
MQAGYAAAPNGVLSSQANTDSEKSKIASVDQPPQGKPPAAPGIVDFEGPTDPYRPMNWPFRKKLITTLLYGLTTCWVTFASSIYSSGLGSISDEFHIGNEVASLGISLVLIGFSLGVLVWAPMSELFGRKWSVLIPYFIAAVFAFGTATGKDIQTVLITRFFLGLFGSAPITNVGGVMADIWSPQFRGIALVSYGLCVVGGPTISPVIGSALTSSYLGWRWTSYLTGIVMMAQFTVDVLVLDETFPSALLVHKARRLRRETNDWSLHAKHEEMDVSFKEIYQKHLIRPLRILCTPICLFITIYSSFIYGILYANLEGYMIEYQENRGWGLLVSSLPFLSLLIGMFCGAALNVWNNKYYFQRFKANGNKAIPEARLPPMMIGGIAFSGGMFLFGWTSAVHINYWPSIIGTVLLGFGFVSIFQACLNYLVDTFTRFSASAVAANTFMRSMVGAAFPLFVVPMYHKLGVNWGSTIFGCIAACLIPVPFLFFVWGKQVRAKGEWSKFSV